MPKQGAYWYGVGAPCMWVRAGKGIIEILVSIYIRVSGGLGIWKDALECITPLDLMSVRGAHRFLPGTIHLGDMKMPQRAILHGTPERG